MVQKKINLKARLFKYLPLILLYFSVLNELDVDVPTLGLISFNLPFIIIFYWSLKDPDHIGNGLIFISGIFNDVTLGYPIGVSSFIYLTIIALLASTSAFAQIVGMGSGHCSPQHGTFTCTDGHSGKGTMCDSNHYADTQEKVVHCHWESY